MTLTFCGRPGAHLEPLFLVVWSLVREMYLVICSRRMVFFYSVLLPTLPVPKLLSCVSSELDTKLGSGPTYLADYKNWRILFTSMTWFDFSHNTGRLCNLMVQISHVVMIILVHFYFIKEPSCLFLSFDLIANSKCGVCWA